MATIATQGPQPKKIATLTLRIGEESDPLSVLAEGRDPDLDGFVYLHSSNRKIATAEFNAPTADKRKRSFVITGRKPGSASILIWSSATRATVDLARIGVTVEDFKSADVDMFYVGKYLVWRRSLPPAGDADGFLVFDASSGTFPIASAQDQESSGPVPEGRYVFLAKFDPLQNTVEKANALLKEGDKPGKGPFGNFRQGIQRLPVGGNGPVNVQWGETRVRLEPQFKLPGKRTGGFYLHDSKKGYTSGCVEVRRNDTGLLFFDALVSYALSDRAKRRPNLVIQVIYRDKLTSTRGRTEEP